MVGEGDEGLLASYSWRQPSFLTAEAPCCYGVLAWLSRAQLQRLSRKMTPALAPALAPERSGCYGACHVALVRWVLGLAHRLSRRR